MEFSRPQDVYMRIALTLEDDIARRLKELARITSRSFREVVNDAIRMGLGLGHLSPGDYGDFVVRPKACGFRAGIDPTKLNQM